VDEKKRRWRGWGKLLVGVGHGPESRPRLTSSSSRRWEGRRRRRRNGAGGELTPGEGKEGRKGRGQV
jgi:hypothetical protein